MAGKNQPPEEWKRIQREAKREVGPKAKAVALPKRLIPLSIAAVLLVPYLIWMKLHPAQADVVPTEKAEIHEPVVPILKPLTPQEKRVESAPPAAPPSDGGRHLPGSGNATFEIKPAE